MTSAIHTPVRVPHGWTMFVSHSDKPVTRLVVFVHGFMGRGVDTWMDFPDVQPDQDYWACSDLLFVRYDSLRENITGVAHHVRQSLPDFYPVPFPGALSVNGVAARQSASDYDELILVGHSLGGVVLRIMLADAAQMWVQAGKPSPQPRLLDAQLVFFSPASAGFRPAGLLGAVRAMGSVWRAVEVLARSSSAFTDLQEGSQVLTEVRQRTEALVRDEAMEMLRARILWANPDNVVVSVRYATDWVDNSYTGRGHRSICKPERETFTEPWSFVEGAV